MWARVVRWWRPQRTVWEWKRDAWGGMDDWQVTMARGAMQRQSDGHGCAWLVIAGLGLVLATVLVFWGYA